MARQIVKDPKAKKRKRGKAAGNGDVAVRAKLPAARKSARNPTEQPLGPPDFLPHAGAPPFLLTGGSSPEFPAGLVTTSLSGAVIAALPWPQGLCPALEKQGKPARAVPARKTAPAAKTGANRKPRAKPPKAPSRAKPASLRQETGETAVHLLQADEPLVRTPSLRPPEQQSASLSDDRAPLSRPASLAPYRKGGVIAVIGFWLRDAGRWLGATTPRRKPAGRTKKRKPGPIMAHKPLLPVHPAPREESLAELRAENARLRLELEAMLAVQEERNAAAAAAASVP